MLILALIIIAGLAVFVYKRKKKLPTDLMSPVIYTNDGVTSLDNPTYIGKDFLDSTNGSVVSDLHFDPRGTYGDDNGGHYLTIPNEKAIEASLDSLANSTEDLIKDDPPHYSTLEYK